MLISKLNEQSASNICKQEQQNYTQLFSFRKTYLNFFNGFEEFETFQELYKSALNGFLDIFHYYNASQHNSMLHSTLNFSED